MTKRTKPSVERRDAERAEMINNLRTLQRTVPDGHYAIIGETGLLEWYRVQKELRDTSKIIVTRLDLDTGPERVSVIAEETRILSQIAADPDGAAQRYEDNSNQGGSMP